MNANTKPVLVIGATGRHGGTGAFVARSLLDRGVPVRAMTRKIDSRVEPAKALGAEIVTADLHDRSSLIKALDGVETAYFTYPITSGIISAAANFASAGRVTHLKRVVVMSMAPAHPESPSQWIAEEVIESAGFSCLHLRIAAVFFENLELLHRADIEGDGVIRNSFADIAVSWIAAEDAGKIAVAALLYPERFGDKVAVYPGGHTQHSHSEIAGVIGNFVGRTLRHETISKDAWRDRIISLAGHDDRIDADMAGHISSVAASLTKPFPPNDIFETVTGETPLSLAEVLETGRLSFGRPVCDSDRECSSRKSSR